MMSPEIFLQEKGKLVVDWYNYSMMLFNAASSMSLLASILNQTDSPMDIGLTGEDGEIICRIIEDGFQRNIRKVDEIQLCSDEDLSHYFDWMETKTKIFSIVDRSNVKATSNITKETYDEWFASWNRCDMLTERNLFEILRVGDER